MTKVTATGVMAQGEYDLYRLGGLGVLRITQHQMDAIGFRVRSTLLAVKQ